ncbi:hypothetical protein BRC85_10105 [Halobacteriales archaeon QS_1_69_70]|nr:MAG: hypothetical protein BRC85_10105 [Halobacteriales archaeon QS_1_69_70]
MRRRAVLRTGAAALTSVAAGRVAGRSPARSPTGPAEPAFDYRGRLPVAGAKELVVDDGVAYVAVSDGFATVDVADPADPTLLAERRDLLADHPDGPLSVVHDGKVGGDRYAVAGPAEPRGGVPNAALVFDVSDPADPQRVLAHETDFPHHNLATDGDTLYLCGNDGDRNPLVCVDVATGAERGRWSVLDADDRWADVHPALRQLHDVSVTDDVAYCSYWEAGTWLVDVSDPTTPEPITVLRGRDPAALAELETESAIREARFTLPGNDHYAIPRGGAAGPLVALNEEAWAAEADATAAAQGGVELWDRRAGERRARIEAPPTADPTHGGTWTTAHNFDYVGDRLYTAWYRGGVSVHDVADPAAPVEVTHWRDEATTDFWTAQAAGDHVVASSWRDVSADRPEEAAAVYTFRANGGATTTPSATQRPDGGPGSGTTTGDGTGLGPLAGAGAVGLAAWARRRWHD